MNVTIESKIPLVVPVLPLDGHVLLPASATPYRVADPRHCRLVGDLVDRPTGERWVAVPADAADGDAAQRARHEGLVDVATLGLVTIATSLEAGEFIVVVEGKSACHLESIDISAHTLAVSYGLAHVRPLADRPEPLARARAATTELIQALFALYESYGLGAGELPQSELPLDDIALVYRIGNAVIESPRERAHLLAERCPARRREAVLHHIVDQMAFAMREGLLGTRAASC